MNDEKRIIELAASGDKESFEKIINHYKNYVFAIILNFIKDNEEAQNISQEVFLQVYISLPTFKEDNFKAWLSRITTNKAIDLLRKKRSRVEETELDKLENFKIASSSLGKANTDNPETLLMDKEAREDVKDQVEALPEIYKLAVREFYFQEKTYEEIARDSGVSKKTVESRLYRARLLLKKNWRDRDDSL
nr:sigma-70 family RNA polymerase sigma factor [Tissierella sp.]